MRAAIASRGENGENARPRSAHPSGELIEEAAKIKRVVASTPHMQNIIKWRYMGVLNVVTQYHLDAQSNGLSQ